MKKKITYLLGLAGAMSVPSSADLLISYRSQADANPDNGDIIDVGVNETIPVEIWATTTIYTWPSNSLASGGFVFNMSGSPPIELSNFSWNQAEFGDHNQVGQNNALPSPAWTNFVHYHSIPDGTGLLLATLDITGTTLAEGFVQTTGPQYWTNANLTLHTLIPGSDRFVVNVIPEPGSLAMLALGAGATVGRRSRDDARRIRSGSIR